MSAVDIMKSAARDGDLVARRCACTGVLSAVDCAADCACGDGSGVARRIARCIRLCECAADNVACHRAAADGDAVLRRFPRRPCGRECSTVDTACRIAAADRYGILLGAAVLRAHVCAIAVHNAAARKSESVLCRIARRQVLPRSAIALRILDQTAVGCRRERAARDGERVVRDSVADLRAARPRLGMYAVRRRIRRRRVVFELIAFKVHRRCERTAVVVRINDILEVPRAAGLRTAAEGIGIVRALHEIDAVCVLHELDLVRLIGLDVRARHIDRGNGELSPVEIVRCRIARQVQHGVRLIDGSVEVKDELVEVLDVPDVRICIDVQRVVRDIAGIRTAMHRARDAARERMDLVAEVHRVARGRAVPCRIACIDVAADRRRTREGDLVPRRAARRTRIRECTAVDIVRHRAAGELHLVLRRTLCRTCCRDGCTVEISRHAAAGELCDILRRRTILRRDLCTVAIRDAAARDRERILCRVAGRYRVPAPVKLVVLDETAVSRGRKCTARDGELVLLHLVADRRASRPAFGMRAISCRICRRRVVAEAEAVDIDILRRVHGMVVRVNDELEVAVRAILCSDRRIGIDAVLHEADAVRIMHQCKEALIVGARRKRRAARDLDLIPVEPRGLIAVTEREQRVRRIDISVEVEAEFLEVLDVPDGRIRIDVQRVARIDRLVAAVDGARDIRAACQSIRPVAEVHGVARCRTRAVRIARINIMHRTARDGNGVARSIARTGMRNIPAVDRARGTSAGDIDLIVRRLAARARREAAVDIPNGAILEVDGILNAVVPRVARRRCPLADRPAAVGIAVVRAIDGKLVLRGGVADHGAACPDVRARIARQRGRILSLVGIAAVENAPDARIVPRIRVDDVFLRPRVGDRLAVVVVRDRDARRIVHERRLTVGRIAAAHTELTPVQSRRRAAVQREHRVSGLDRAVEIEIELAKVRDVPRRRLAVDIEDIVRRVRLVAAVDRARDTPGGNNACHSAVAEVDRVARGRTRAARVAAVEIAADGRCTREGNGVARRLPRCTRPCDRAAVQMVRHRAAREEHLVAHRLASLRLYLCAVGTARNGAARNGKRIRLRIARGLERAVARALVVLDVAAVGIRKRPTADGEFIVLDLISGRCAPCPCGVLRAVRCSKCRTCIVLELEAIDIDIARRMDRVVVRVDDVLVIPVRALLRSNRIVRIRRALHETDACSIIHEGKEALVIGFRRKAVVFRCDLDTRPVKPRRCATCNVQQRTADRLARQVEIHLGKVLHAAYGDILALDVQCVVRVDIARAHTAAAVEECTAHSEAVRFKIDGVLRRLARALSVAAVNIGVRAERAARNGDRILRGIAVRGRRERIVRRNVAGGSRGSGVQSPAADLERILLCVRLRRRIVREVSSRCRNTRCVAAVGIRHRAAREVQRIVIRSALDCVRVARARIRIRTRADGDLIVVRGVAVRRIAAVHRRADDCRCRHILEAVAVNGENRCTDCSRRCDIGLLAKLIITVVVDELRDIIVECERWT